MADDVIVKFRVDDQGVLDHLKELNKLQKNLTTTTKKATTSNKESQKSFSDLNAELSIQAQTLADVERQKQKEIRSTIIGKDARRANTVEIKKENRERKDELNALKAAIIARHKQSDSLRKNASSHKFLQFEMNKTSSGLFDITTKNRLVEGSFATMRSKLLLTSFAFGLVTTAVTRNIQAFATQEESVARLAMTFGRAASKELQEYASALQKVTRFGDESINAVMAQFGAYGATIQQTKSLTQATLDLAEGTQMDLNSAALIIAKSFGTSTNALSRYGIELSSSMTTQEKINAIVQQSEKRYGGLSKLLGQLSGSSVKQLSMATGDLAEKLGEALADGLLPIIRGLTSFAEALDTKHMRIMINMVVSLTVALGILKGAGAILGVINAFRAASIAAVAYNIKLITTTGATIGLTTATRVFFKALVVNTGGLYALVIVLGAATLAILELFGAFGKSNKEQDELNKLLDESNDKFKKFNTGNANQQLDEFYNKLVEGNDLLRILNDSFQVNLVDAFNFEPLESEVKDFVDSLQTQIDTLESGTGTLSIPFSIDEIKAKKDIEQTLKDGFAFLSTLPPPGQIFGDVFKQILTEQDKKDLQSRLDDINQDIDQLQNQISNAAASPDVLGAAFQRNFQEITGVSDQFFRKFVQNSGIQKAVEDGLIKNNRDLVTVLQASVNGKIVLNNETIKELLLKNELLDVQKLLKQQEQESLDLLNSVISAGSQELQQKIDRINLEIAEAQAVEKKDAVLIAGIKAKQDALAALEEQQKSEAANEKMRFVVLSKVATDKMKIYSQLANGFASLNQASKGSALVTARLQQIAAVIDAVSAASSAAAEAPLGMKTIAAAAQYAMGMARVVSIEQQLSKMNSVSTKGQGTYGSYEYGGYVGGNRHSQGGTLIEAERGEFVMSRRAVNAIGLETLNNMNQSGGGSGSVTVNVSGNVLTQDYVEGELAESIKEAVRRGSDFGIG